MTIEPISALKLISDLVISVADSAKKIKGTPKQQFARKIIVIFDFLGDLEKQAENIISELKFFESESTIGMRVHHIHKCGILLDKFSDTCQDFIYWYDKEKQPTAVLELYSPTVSKYLKNIRKTELDMYREKDNWYIDLQEKITAFKRALQAVNSPDPVLFPDAPFVREVIDELQRLIQKISKTKTELRKFATQHISIDDFF